jgi:hypothetical protein
MVAMPLRVAVAAYLNENPKENPRQGGLGAGLDFIDRAD